MSTITMTAEEFTESLTGFDEIAIEKQFDLDIYLDGERKPVKLLRALIFIDQTRKGLTVDKAKDAAMGMPLSECSEYFADEELGLDEENPETPSGNGSGPSD